MEQLLQTAAHRHSAILGSLAPLALKRSGFRLSFPAILEQQYRLDTAPARVADLTLIAQSGVGLYILFSLVINGLLIQHTSWLAVLWQLGAVILTYAVATRFIANGVPFRLREGAFLAICLVGTLAAILAIAAKTPPVTLRDLIFALLPLNFVLVFARLPFSAAVALCICVSLLFVAVVLRDPNLAPNDTSLLLGALAILVIPSLCGLHCLERAIRRLYLLELIQRLNYERELAANAVLTDLSFTDALTGVPNRRRLDEALARLGAMTAPSAALLLIDIDFFKRFNDLYGHAVGDDCLRSVALCLTRELRAPDLLARLGGEEFAVLLTDITSQDALALGDRLRRAVEQTAFPVGKETATITISIGLATMPPNAHPQALFAAADEALYRAKSLGRNRVCGPRRRMGSEAELSPLAKA